MFAYIYVSALWGNFFLNYIKIVIVWKDIFDIAFFG